MARTGTVVFRELAGERAGELVAAGHRRRHVFPHRTLFLPRPGPDGFRLAKQMVGERDPAAMRELVLHATGSALDGIPSELFFDDDIVWHQQQFGLPGQIATADVVIAGTTMWSMAHVADVVQRIGRRREFKTHIESRFSGWQDLLLNALLGLAVELGVTRVHVPTSDFQRRNTDPARNPKPELFDRIYDRAVNRLYQAEPSGDWWTIDVVANRARIVAPDRREEAIGGERTVCVCHDIEAGLGHLDTDPAFARQADASWRAALERMLEIEHAAGVRATYNVVGVLHGEVRGQIEAAGHCVAFHSYDHRIGRPWLPWGRHDQLARCRDLDYRLKGYRPPRSRITRELRDENLLFHNVEWLSSSAGSLGEQEPVMLGGLVRLPVHLDDFGLFRKETGYEAWRTRALATASEHDVAVISLHDCYGHLWLDGYAELLDRLRELGELRTLDQVAADVTLAASL